LIFFLTSGPKKPPVLSALNFKGKEPAEFRKERPANYRILWYFFGVFRTLVKGSN